MRPSVAALADIAAPEAFWELCRDELSGVDVATGGWDIRARWFGVVICATPRLGELDRGITISWRAIAAQITLGWRPIVIGTPSHLVASVMGGTAWLPAGAAGGW